MPNSPAPESSPQEPPKIDVFPETIAEGVARNFVLALQESEASGDPGLLVEQFSGDCALMSVGNRSIYEGRDGAEQFWRNYLGQFDEVSSRFTNVFYDDSHIALEWATEAKTRSGHPLLYEGATILTLEEGKIKDFRTYFDTAVFLTRHHGNDHANWAM